MFVPFSAIKGFFDPSVQFGLQFEVAEPTSGPKQVDIEPAEDNDVTQDNAAHQDLGEDGEASGEKVVSLNSFRKK